MIAIFAALIVLILSAFAAICADHRIKLDREKERREWVLIQEQERQCRLANGGCKQQRDRM